MILLEVEILGWWSETHRVILMKLWRKNGIRKHAKKSAPGIRTDECLSVIPSKDRVDEGVKKG